MRSMILAVAVVGVLAFVASSANAQVGVVVGGSPVYGTGVTIAQPYTGYAGYGYAGRVYQPAVSVVAGPTYYSSGYRGVVAPAVGVYPAATVYAPAPVYYRRGLFGRRYYAGW